MPRAAARAARELLRAHGRREDRERLRDVRRQRQLGVRRRPRTPPPAPPAAARARPTARTSSRPRAAAVEREHRHVAAPRRRSARGGGRRPRCPRRGCRVVSLILSAASSAAAYSSPRAATNSRARVRPPLGEPVRRLGVVEHGARPRRASRRARRASKGTGPVAAATAATASIWPVTVFVAGTARSGPTPRASTASAAPPSGLSASLTIATVRAPPRLQPPADGDDLGRLARLADRDDEEAAVVRRARRSSVCRLGAASPAGRPDASSAR